jgi:hypothetical protein
MKLLPLLLMAASAHAGTLTISGFAHCYSPEGNSQNVDTLPASCSVTGTVAGRFAIAGAGASGDSLLGFATLTTMAAGSIFPFDIFRATSGVDVEITNSFVLLGGAGHATVEFFIEGGVPILTSYGCTLEVNGVTMGCSNSNTNLYEFAVEFGTPFGLHMLMHATAEGSLLNLNGLGFRWNFTEPTIRQGDAIVEGSLVEVSDVPEPSTLAYGLTLFAIALRRATESGPCRQP